MVKKLEIDHNEKGEIVSPSYVDTDFEYDACKQKTVSYQREFIENHKERMKQLLDDFKNERGKIPVCNDAS